MKRSARALMGWLTLAPILTGAITRRAFAADPPPSATQAEPEPTRVEAPPAEPAAPPAPPAADSGVREVRVEGGIRGALGASAGSRVSRRDLDERLPRSAPDAVRYEPGVFVQQTAHGQGSPFLRGRTGQQTVVLFDGIRMNTSTWRQGPNQYFFTLDARSIESIDVVRGGGSTVYGSDALGGVLLANPLQPSLPDPENRPLVPLRPRGFVRYATADSDASQRLQIDAPLADRVQIIAGAGFRRAGKLKSAGTVTSPSTGLPAMVPIIEADGETQQGTGFRELTGDLRIVFHATPRVRVTGAAYVYRQYDAPRTDQCSPPFAPITDCLQYDEQFRTLAYVSVEGDLGAAAETFAAALSFQRQHERRTRRRPASFVENGGRDDVNTVGAYARATSRRTSLSRGISTRVRYGGDVYRDTLDSNAYTRFTDIQRLVPSSRGQYLAGSRYVTGGAFVEDELDLGGKAALTVGSRLGAAAASAPGDAESGTKAVDQDWLLHAAHANLTVPLGRSVSLIGGIDRSVRAPNLDDLTSRQSTGPGFQFENPGLGVEKQTAFEAGARFDTHLVRAELWAFRSYVAGAITRIPRSVAECPANTPGCGASWSRYQLVNAPGEARIDGLEAAFRATPAPRVTLRGTFAYTFGIGDNPAPRSNNPLAPYEEKVPLSRIPPMNGTAEARFRLTEAIQVGGAMRWALAQTRLAFSDRTDGRIPTGGTPGFAVFDLRAGYRHRRDVIVSLVVENVTNAPHRYHGSSINGAARGVIASVDFGL